MAEALRLAVFVLSLAIAGAAFFWLELVLGLPGADNCSGGGWAACRIRLQAYR